MDIDPSYDVDIVGDFKQMPFQDASFDVIVFDPPHRPVSAGNNSAYSKYNEGVADEHRVGDISDLFPPFLSEAKRILKPGGIVLAKLADLVHNHRYSWIQVDFINAVRESGMTPCDMMIKIDPCAGNLKSGHWKNVNHLRKKHCYWIVVRNSKKCECK
jgi:ubiquinone/menaquinone biosynthesis C-methylase UbiE